MLYINGEIVQDNKFVNEFQRLVRFGEGFFETMKLSISHSSPLWSEYHIERIKKGLAYFKIEANINKIEIDILSFIQQLKLSFSEDIEHFLRVTFTPRSESIGYSKANYHGEMSMLMEVVSRAKLAKDRYTLTVYELEKYHGNLLNNSAGIKICANGMFYQNILEFAKQAECNDAVICYNNLIYETGSSNIFLYKNNKIYTPPLKNIVRGVVRSALLENLSKIIQQPLSIDDLLEADQVFTTNISTGIKLVDEIIF